MNEQPDEAPKPAPPSLLGPAAAPLVINLLLFVAAVALALIGMIAGGTLGLVLIGVGAVMMIVGFVVLLLGNRRIAASDPELAGAGNWWYNVKTGEVEHGEQSLGSDRDGPYRTRDEAERAPEIARERSAKWAAEDEEKREA